MSKTKKEYPKVKHYNTGGCNCCDIEILATFIVLKESESLETHDIETYKRTSIITATGPANMKGAKVLKKIYDDTPDPKIVVSVGTCASSGGIFVGCPNILGGIDKVVPVDIYIPGCPVRPEQVIAGLSEALKRLEEKAGYGSEKK